MHKSMREGKAVSLKDVLDMREQRAAIQHRLLKEHPGTLVSFSLNIPGETKVFPLEKCTFQEGIRLIGQALKQAQAVIIAEDRLIHAAGDTYFCVTDADADKVKRALLSLEEECTAGRIFDMDVLDSSGHKLSRRDFGLPGRTCLICGEDAFVCGRSRRHDLQAVFDKVCDTMEEYLEEAAAKGLAALAVTSLKEEVHVTPKPGLVDEKDNGAHTDMDLPLFEKSASVLEPYFLACAQAGIHHTGSAQALCRILAEHGKEAERRMFAATNGVNTHKGAIFSLGILVAAAGMFYTSAKLAEPGALRSYLSEQASKIAQCKMNDFFNQPKEEIPEELAFGQKAFGKYGITGVRGEAAAGFPTLFETAIPCYEVFLGKGASRQEALIATLLMILSKADDTNIIKRAGIEQLRTLQTELSSFFAEAMEREDSIKAVIGKAEELNRIFIRENISPGGSADLLALLIFVTALPAHLPLCNILFQHLPLPH